MEKGTVFSNLFHLYWLNIHYSMDYITHTHTKEVIDSKNLITGHIT